MSTVTKQAKHPVDHQGANDHTVEEDEAERDEDELLVDDEDACLAEFAELDRLNALDIVELVTRDAPMVDEDGLLLYDDLSAARDPIADLDDLDD